MTRPAASRNGPGEEELSLRLELLDSRRQLETIRRLLEGSDRPSSTPAPGSKDLVGGVRALLAERRELLQLKSSHRYRLASFMGEVARVPIWLVRKVAAVARRIRVARALGGAQIRGGKMGAITSAEHRGKTKLPSLPPPEAAPRLASGLRVAAVLDQFSAIGLGRECSLKLLQPDEWAEQIREHKPHMLLVESAWMGSAGEWSGKVEGAPAVLRALVLSCRSAGIPTVFWNKEDPLHLRAFLETAALFDHVLTTDADSVPRYRRLLGHDRVGVMLFAVQPRIHHPVSAERRRPSSVFAGAWYGRLAGRASDFERAADALSLAGDLAIHDRHSGRGEPHQRFPARFRGMVRPSVPYEETAELFRRHVIGLTLNTVKTSPTMFARRALEMAACGTSVYSNHCLALHLLMGDGVVASDTPERLFREAWHELRNPGAASCRHRRLRALRTAMNGHTWAHRLRQLGQIALGTPLGAPRECIAVVARVQDEEALGRVCESFQRQIAGAKLVLDAPTGLPIPPFAERLESFDPASVEWIALFHSDDHYGPRYLSDLLMASRWGLADVIGKGAWHEVKAGHVVEQRADDEYRFVDALALRRVMFRAAVVYEPLKQLLDDIDAGTVEAPRCISTDAWEYLQGGAGGGLAAVVDVRCSATVAADDVQREGSSLPAQPDAEAVGARAIDAREFFALMVAGKGTARVSVGHRRGGMEICSLLDVGETAELRSAPLARRRLETDGRLDVCLQASRSSGLDLRVEAVGRSGRVLGALPMPPLLQVTLTPPAGTSHYQLVVRATGPTVEEVDGVWLGSMPVLPLFSPGRGRLALVCNGYPSDGNLYRNAFLHRRVLAYRQHGIGVDVFVVRCGAELGDYEFDGVLVRECPPGVLGATLARSGHAAVAVHFLDEVIWGVVRKASPDTPVVVWLHGAEVQSWRHRRFNYTTPEQQKAAEFDSASRVRLWQEVLRTQGRKLHFVAVSRYLAEQTWSDLETVPPAGRWSVVHNPIDTELFGYRVKSPAMARRILSIRPHASRIYANDLVAKAILRLADEEIFRELEFTLVGDGDLWTENFASLEQFPNVTLIRGFVSQEEIAGLHREHGVFLVPTRGDTHGVSRDEAMSSGLVPVSNDVAAVPEFVDASCGELCPPEDPDALAAAIMRLATDPERFVSMSAQAAGRVRKQSASRNMVARELSILGFADGNIDGCRPPSPITTSQAIHQ